MRGHSDAVRPRQGVRDSSRSTVPSTTTWLLVSPSGFTSTGFIRTSGRAPAASAWKYWAAAISPPSTTRALLDMLNALKGAILTPRRAKQRVSAVTRKLFPAQLEHPCTMSAATKKEGIEGRGRAPIDTPDGRTYSPGARRKSRVARERQAKSGPNPALSRHCEAPSGDEPGRSSLPRMPVLGGRAVRAAIKPPSLPSSSAVTEGGCRVFPKGCCPSSGGARHRVCRLRVVRLPREPALGSILSARLV